MSTCSVPVRIRHVNNYIWTICMIQYSYINMNLLSVNLLKLYNHGDNGNNYPERGPKISPWVTPI